MADADTARSDDAPQGPLSLSLADWWCVLKAVGATADRANLALIAAGLAFFGLMAVIPGLAAFAALVGLFADPQLLADQIQALGGVAPDAVVSIIHGQVLRLLEDAELSRRVSASAAGRALTQFTWHEAQKKLVRVYRRLLD